MWVVIGLVAPASWLLTWGVRRYALARSVLDIPSSRSLHTHPVPRGGGVAIVVTTLIGVAVASAVEILSAPLAVAVAGGGIMIAGIGWLDDHRPVSIRLRATIHFLAAIWAMAWLDGLPILHLGFAEVQLGRFGTPLAVFGIVGVTNLYNFMDGIDGLAAGEAVSFGLVGGVLLYSSGRPDLATVLLLVAAASGGFLVWNWPPAKIFMGDVGSGFLGYLVAVVSIASETAGTVPIVLWILLTGVFAFDATVTLLRRVWRGERWYQAHKSHAYQRAVQAGGSHQGVTVAALVINVLLACLVVWAWHYPPRIVPAAIVGASLLAIVYLGIERRYPMS